MPTPLPSDRLRLDLDILASELADAEPASPTPADTPGEGADADQPDADPAPRGPSALSPPRPPA